jgi:hypothetical protein
MLEAPGEAARAAWGESPWTPPPAPPKKTSRTPIIVAVIVGFLVIAGVALGVSRSSDDAATTSSSATPSTSSSDTPTGPTIRSDDKAVSLKLPNGWKGLSVEAGVDHVGATLFPDDADLASEFQQRATILPRIVVLFALDVAHVARGHLTANLSVIADPTAPVTMSLEAVGKAESKGVAAFGGTLQSSGVVDLGSIEAFRYTYSASQFGGVGFVIKGSAKVWVLTYTFPALDDEAIAIATGSAATFDVP